MKKRRSTRALTRNSEVPKSTLQDHIKRGGLNRHTNSILSTLTESNEIDRLKYNLSKINPETIDTDPQFKDGYDEVHVDEKWFEITEVNQRVILIPGEIAPYRTCKNKKFLEKIMFLCASARPRFHPETNECIFDGKIGIWPFVEKVPAQRGSINRPRGTLETKSVIVTREVYLEMLINELIPAILTKFPAEDLDRPIYVQQDNARPHIVPNDPDFAAAVENQGLQLVLTNQAANSPDENVNDLGFSCAIQALQQEETANTVDELIEHVQQAYAAYDPRLLNRIWLTHQHCMIKTMEVRGSNRYSIPHMRKAALERQGILPESLHIPLDLVNQTRALVAAAEIENN